MLPLPVSFTGKTKRTYVETNFTSSGTITIPFNIDPNYKKIRVWGIGGGASCAVVWGCRAVPKLVVLPLALFAWPAFFPGSDQVVLPGRDGLGGHCLLDPLGLFSQCGCVRVHVS